MQYGNYDDLKVYKDEEGKFKSYYVVWKPGCSRLWHLHRHSLNRTMQYGNCCERKYFFRIMTFKSYYVVWKLVSPAVFSRHTPTFKSYYVVWKRSDHPTRHPQALSFKSYYVVWKLDEPFSIAIRKNRFKSYYVVWKQHSTK